MGNLRNMSVPRGSQQKSYLISSQDYNSQNTQGGSNAYYDKQANKVERLSYNRAATEALNSSVANIKLTDLSSNYGVEAAGLHSHSKNLNETAPIITSQGVGLSITGKQHTLGGHGTIKACSCPCNCGLQ